MTKLGMPLITDFTEFMNIAGLDARQKAADADPDGDGLKNFAEFALPGNDPVAGPAVAGAAGQSSGHFTLNWRPSFCHNAYAATVCQWSSGPTGWADVPAAQIVESADGNVTDSVPTTSQPLFLRLKVTVTS